ncbi:MAG TPA: permease prefix domain 1-containing protein [Pyrinomonadaceae bacterium]|nr:permease prefix domain 1-containing protein [Pyrinomonadaceae bacterium]
MKIADLLKRHQKTSLDVEEELRFHIEMLEHKYLQQGMSAAAAKAAALQRFGNLEIVKRRCVTISRRSSPLRRVLKILSILVAVTGLAIHILSSDPKIAHVGDTLIMIAISGRLLLYVRGLSSSTIKQIRLDTAPDQEKPECS